MIYYNCKRAIGFRKRYSSQTPSYLICDTDLLTIKIWSEYKYGSCDPEIMEFLKNNLPDLYLLASPDFPWEEIRKEKIRTTEMNCFPFIRKR